MQFRERRRVIQVIRTVYDKDRKRSRSEVVGKIEKSEPAVSDKLRKRLDGAEIEEVEAWLARRAELQRSEEMRAGAMALPQQMVRAAAYFRACPNEDSAVHAAAIRAGWIELKAALRAAGFSKSRLSKMKIKNRTDRPIGDEPDTAKTVPPIDPATPPVVEPAGDDGALAEAAPAAAPAIPVIPALRMVEAEDKAPVVPPAGEPAAVTSAN